MCCLFGIADYKGNLKYSERRKLLKTLSICCEERGTDAAGIAYKGNAGIEIIKNGVPARKLNYKLPADVKVVMGHTRLTTQGSEKKNYNNHPFMGLCGKKEFALAHNGVIFNDDYLKVIESLPKTVIETDSYVAVQLIEKYGVFNAEAIVKMAESIEGSFCFTLLDDENSLYIVKGNNPMAVYDFKDNGFYIYASTEEILNKALKQRGFLNIRHEKIILKEGDILKLNPDGSRESFKFNYNESYYSFGKYGIYNYSSIYSDEACCYGYGNDEEIEKELLDYAKIAGVDESDVFALIEMGYSYFEIEDMLMEPEFIHEYIYGCESC